MRASVTLAEGIRALNTQSFRWDCDLIPGGLRRRQGDHRGTALSRCTVKCLQEWLSS